MTTSKRGKRIVTMSTGGGGGWGGGGVVCWVLVLGWGGGGGGGGGWGGGVWGGGGGGGGVFWGGGGVGVFGVGGGARNLTFNRREKCKGESVNRGAFIIESPEIQPRTKDCQGGTKNKKKKKGERLCKYGNAGKILP